jgi:hypothetical protein
MATTKLSEQHKSTHSQPLFTMLSNQEVKHERRCPIFGKCHSMMQPKYSDDVTLGVRSERNTEYAPSSVYLSTPGVFGKSTEKKESIVTIITFDLMVEPREGATDSHGSKPLEES